MKSDLNFALIGCGRIGLKHAEEINKYASLVAVCDIKKENAKRFSEIFSVPSYDNIDDMLALVPNIDVVSICTPNGLHAEHAIQSLRAKKHVLVEKPMALSVSDCEAMIRVAEISNRRLFVVKQNRFNPPIQALKNVIDKGRLGKILSVQLNCFWNRNNEYYLASDWKGTKSLDGGTLFTQFSHFIDLLYWMFGDIKEAKTFMSNSNHAGIIEFEDSGVAILKFDKDVICSVNYTVNSYRQNMEGSITVFGEKGTIKVGGQYLNKLEYQLIENYKIENLPESSPANQYGTYQGSMSNHDKVYENVIDVLTKEGSITTSFLDGLKTVQIIEKIYSTNNIE